MQVRQRSSEEAMETGTNTPQHFLNTKGKEESKISLEEFKKGFGEVCLDGPHSLALKKYLPFSRLLSVILCESSFEDQVPKERFCNLVGWFGPIDRENYCHGFYTRIKELLTQK